VPPETNSAMDGYALLAETSHEGKNTLPIKQRFCAGEPKGVLEPATMARIFTGAVLPAKADAVIMQEQVQIENGQACFDGKVKVGQNVRQAGEDIAIGSEALAAGKRIRSQEIGLLASIGHDKISVFRKVKVAVFFTGDELVEPGNTLSSGKIYNSNRYMLLGLLQELGCEVIDLGVVADTFEATEQVLKQAATKADLVITTGGVSVGEEDHVRKAVETLGELSLWKVAMKPGKPLAFGHIKQAQKTTPIIGLPGNPVSVFATFYLFTAPFVKKMQGMSECLPSKVQVLAGFSTKKATKRQEHLRTRLKRNDQGHTVAEIYSHQGSGVLTSTSWADGFVIVPIGDAITQGDKVDYLAFSDLL